MRIAVTGAGGFIGMHLVPELEKTGYEVVEISRKKDFDLNDWKSVNNIPKCDVIVHLAAKTFVPDSFENPREFYQTNINLTLNALELARKWQSKVIYMSSYFYGPPNYTPVDEKHPLNPHNPYAQTKYLSEDLCKAYSKDFDLPVVAFRLFNIYGPGQTGSFLIPDILYQIKELTKIRLKDPRPKRDYIHVDDVVSVILAALDFDHEGFHVFNLGTGKSVSVEKLVSIIQKYSSHKFEVEYTHEYRKGEVLDSVADNSKLISSFGIQGFLDIETGIKLMI